MRANCWALAFAVLSTSCDTTYEVDDPLTDPNCCPSWVGSDSLLAFRDTGLSDYDRAGVWIRPRDRSKGWKVVDGAYFLSYSAVAGRCAFERDRQIFTAPFENGVIDTLAIQQLTFGGSNFFPVWSPDGEWIAYDQRYCENVYDDADTTCGVFAVRPNGSGSHFVARGVYPQWSPDGSHLVFARHGVVYSIDFPAFSEARQLSTFHEDFDRLPVVAGLSYSPDGSTILVELRTHPGASIWGLPATGGPAKRWFDGRYPSWSPSGKFIAFVEYGNADPLKDGTVWIFNRDSHRVVQFTYR